MKTTSEVVQLKDTIPPQSVAAAGNATSGWVDASAGGNILTTVMGGDLGGGTVALTLEQASDSSGIGAKAVSGADAGAGLSADNSEFSVDNAPELLDHENGFTYVRAKLTVTGGTGALVAAAVQITDPRYSA